MKKYALLAGALVLATSTVAEAGVHVVGGGTPDSNNTFPFWGSYPAFRWQTMWFQTELNETGPVSKIEWQVYAGGGGSGGIFRDCDILLCHTGIKATTSTFKDNYGGNTPVKVFSGTYALAPSTPNQWMTIVEPKDFTYNNKDNLLIEISWQGGVGGSTQFKTREGGEPPFPGRVWHESSKTAPSGSTQSNYHHYGRITIGYVGVEPTSLGRVKSIFK